MSGYWQRDLKIGDTPLPEDITPTGGGDSDSSEGIAALLRTTNPERISTAGDAYLKIADDCRISVEELGRQAGVIAQTLGGEAMKDIFETIGKLQRDLAQIQYAATSVGQPLKWYGGEVLPWFKANVPGTGSMSWDADLADEVLGTDGNGHILARHHLRNLNTYMVDVYNAIGGQVEQRSKAPLTGVPGPSEVSPLAGLTANPYTGSGLGSPYASPGFGTPPGLSATTPDLPGLKDPSFQNPSLPDPSLQNPPPKDPPSLPDPSPQNPAPQNPQLPQVPQTPGFKAPELNTPNLAQTPPRTDLSGMQPPSLPQTPAPYQQPAGPGAFTGPGSGPGIPVGTSAATPFGGPGSLAAGAGRGGMGGMPMGMVPPMTGGAQAGQERDRERDRLPLVEDEAFESEDMGGPSVIA